MASFDNLTTGDPVNGDSFFLLSPALTALLPMGLVLEILSFLEVETGEVHVSISIGSGTGTLVLVLLLLVEEMGALILAVVLVGLLLRLSVITVGAGELIMTVSEELLEPVCTILPAGGPLVLVED